MQMEQKLRQFNKNDDETILLRSFISKETILSYDTAETSTKGCNRQSVKLGTVRENEIQQYIKVLTELQNQNK